MKLDFESLEQWIRAGQFEKVERALKAVAPRKIPREQALAVANTARRVNQFLLALKILNPIVRAEKHSAQAAATPGEQIEYAESLRKLGAVEEARQILAGVDAEEFPQALLIQAFCCFSQWRYDLALPLLRRYETSKHLSEYQRLVGRINLAAALVQQNQLTEAALLLSELRGQTLSGGHSLLHGNSLELSAQLGLRERDYAQVHSHLDAAEGILKNAASLEWLWTQKWRAIASSLEAGVVRPELLSIRERAREAGHWETYRDCCFHIANISRDRELMSRVYVGTPFPSYRENILRETKAWFTPPSQFVKAGQKGARTLIAETGKLRSGEDIFPVGQTHHRLLLLISADLFRPMPLVAAFAHLFPDEYFNALSSPARVHQAVLRLRKTIKEYDLGFEIKETGGTYFLNVLGDTGIQLSLKGPAAASSRDLHLALVLREFGRAEFSVSQASGVLGASTSTSQRLLRWAVRESKLKIHGHGPLTRYQAA